MDEATKAKLREYAVRKKARTIRPSDISPGEICMAVDEAMNARGIIEPPKTEIKHWGLARLSFLPRLFERTLVTVLPCVYCRMSDGPGKTRVVALFHEDFVVDVLRLLKIDRPGKAGTFDHHWNVRSVTIGSWVRRLGLAKEQATLREEWLKENAG
jgi:hypothetical protein